MFETSQTSKERRAIDEKPKPTSSFLGSLWVKRTFQAPETEETRAARMNAVRESFSQTPQKNTPEKEKFFTKGRTDSYISDLQKTIDKLSDEKAVLDDDPLDNPEVRKKYEDVTRRLKNAEASIQDFKEHSQAIEPAKPAPKKSFLSRLKFW